jgi:hypothetical protein
MVVRIQGRKGAGGILLVGSQASEKPDEGKQPSIPRHPAGWRTLSLGSVFRWFVRACTSARQVARSMS